MTTSKPNTGELIEQLHTFDNVDAVTITIAKAALLFIADRLESQEQTIADKDAKIAELTERAERAERERDAAVADFEEYVNGHWEDCKFCFYDNECEPNESRCYANVKSFKWRNIQQGE